MKIKPFLKWVGGKTQLLEHILNKLPEKINSYHEIFLGGGSVLFALLDSKSLISGEIYAYDINETLISTYKNIQNNVSKVWESLSEIITIYKSYNEKQQEEYYYLLRSFYNELTTEQKNAPLGSALFIFLNKTCFRGLYRIGPKGFNVPFGHYKNPEIASYEHLKQVSELIQGVFFETCDFSDSLVSNNLNENDFVYLDPPYAPENSKSFDKYTKDGFTLEQHTELIKLCKTLKEKNVNFLLSNSYVPFILSNFETYNIQTLEARRAINSKNPESKTREVLISNY